MVAPEITHLQAFVLFQLARGEQRGELLRRELEREGIAQEGPTFHACIRRLVRDGLIVRRAVKAQPGSRGRGTDYKLTPAGRQALKELRGFYRRMERRAKRVSK